MKIKRKIDFGMNHSFMKSFSRNFEVLTQSGDVINPKFAQKGSKLVLHVPMSHVKMAFTKTFLLKVHIDLVFIIQPQIVENIPSKSPFRSGFHLSTTNCI